MPLRRVLMLPHLVWWGARAPRGTQNRWDRYWAGVGATGDGGDVLWDSSDPAELERYLELFERFAAPARAVVDLGCGNGRFTRALSRRGWRAIGVDVSDAAIALARAETDRVGEVSSPRFLVADLAAPGALDRVREELGDANVLVRGVLHVLTAEARGQVARNIRHLLGDRGVAVIAETNHRGSLLSYLESLGAGVRGLPRPLARAIASGLPTPRPFGQDELEQTFPDEEWERVHLDDAAVIHAVPMRRRSDRAERIPGFVAVLRPRQENRPSPSAARADQEQPRIPDPRSAVGESRPVTPGQIRPT
ncbi:class I SAM-dependent methyltransferase [Actinomycetospora chiangmaiensis]|uniref:class I SAM-dependent methyltransferase n=1 Tax=Actinomycetospora chiangmaiensis TaxID=402650 RepID=UPI000370CAC1|nr:class I SAM-dependent methyltransferase [Actinomycetospora chiangmaiensis]